MLKLLRATSGALALAFFAVNPVSSAPITLNFSGTVQFTNGFLFFGVTSPGATLSGSITYDSATPDLALDPTVGAYNNTVTSFSYTIDSIVGSSAGGSIGVGNNYAPPNPSDAGDVFQALGASSYTSVSGGTNLDYQLRLLDNQGTALSSDSLPLNGNFFGGGSFAGVSDQASLTLFLSNGAFGFTGVSDDTLIKPQFGPIVALFATIDSVTSETVSGISEPAILVLFAFGAVGIAAANRYSRRKRT